MPFKKVDSMDEKKSFIRDYLTGDYYFSSLCEYYEISRKTGYKWVNRYEELGEEGLDTRTSRPRYLANSISPELVGLIVKLRNPTSRATIGAGKIRTELLRFYPMAEVPSSTTIHNVLIREGLVNRRKKRRRSYPVNTKNNPGACNEMWTIDYKGHFMMGNKRRCHPLTICDSYGRYLLRVKGQYKETTANVKKVLRSVFRQYGQPKKILSDNGSCFASIQSPCGFGGLAYWLIDHGIMPIYSDPGCPGQNGRHERMHRDLKSYCCRPAAKNLSSQNRLLNEFTNFYNTKRPHAELDGQYPSEVYVPSLVSYTEKVKPVEYDEGLMVRRVLSNGAIRWGGSEWVMINHCLKGKRIGLKQISELVYEVYYRHVNIGYYELGEQIENGRYYRLLSDRDFPQRERDRKARSRKVGSD